MLYICSQLKTIFLLFLFHFILTLNYHLLSRLWIQFWQRLGSALLLWNHYFYFCILYVSFSSNALIYLKFFLLCNLFLGGKCLRSCFPFDDPIVLQLMYLRSLYLVVRTSWYLSNVFFICWAVSWWWLMSLLFAVYAVW